MQETLTPTLSRTRDSGHVASLREWEHDKLLQKLRASALRQVQTDAEALLWSKLRDRTILDLKFRPQRPIGFYFADFACLEIGLVIELDGGQHVDNAYDIQRESDMHKLGFQTLRFWNNDVLTQVDAVLEKIFQTAQTLTLTLALSRAREREQEISRPRAQEREQEINLSGKREREQEISRPRAQEREQEISLPRAQEREQEISRPRKRERKYQISLSRTQEVEQDEPVSVPSPVLGRGLG